jgi:hypothetical protein
VQVVDTAQVVTQFLLLRRDDQIPTAHSSFAFACQTAGRGEGAPGSAIGGCSGRPQKACRTAGVPRPQVTLGLARAQLVLRVELTLRVALPSTELNFSAETLMKGVQNGL